MSAKTSDRGVADLARVKKLPLKFLRDLGLTDVPQGILIPYYTTNGSIAPRQRIRVSKAGEKNKSIWDNADGEIVPYGLHRQREGFDAGFFIMNEGESDSWTLWHQGFPSMGVPGATMTSCLRPEYLDGVEKLYVMREPDAAGEEFVKGVAEKLRLFNWRGTAFAVSLDGAKDVSQLYMFDPAAFNTKFQQALDRAVPLDVGENGLPQGEQSRLQIANIGDMPESVLSGRLGELYQRNMREFPIAYAWVAIVTCAGTLVTGTALRSNIYAGLVGLIGSGKTQAIERAMRSVGIDPFGDVPPVMNLKAGSGEGLLKAIGDVAGAARLYSVDELSHLLEKSQIQNSAFPGILNGLFYNSRQKLRIARGEAVDFHCRLSVLGGLLEETFGDLFGKATTGGLYDRFIFGQCPTDFNYLYRPFQGQPLAVEPVTVAVHPEVWAERDCWIKTIPGVTGRIAEIALRVASICAAFDGKDFLMVSDLAPARAFAEYQARIRILLRPNPGENFEARAAFKFLAYLQRHAPDGQWLGKREMLRETHCYELGPSTCNKALNTLGYNGDIEEKQEGRKSFIRMVP